MVFPFKTVLLMIAIVEDKKASNLSGWQPTKNVRISIRKCSKRVVREWLIMPKTKNEKSQIIRLLRNYNYQIRDRNKKRLNSPTQPKCFLPLSIAFIWWTLFLRSCSSMKIANVTKLVAHCLVLYLTLQYNTSS